MSEPRETGPVLRDSLGIRIIENREPAWTEGEHWRVDAEPALSLGTVAGDPSQQLFGVVDAVRLPDGRIVVANAGSSDLRYFDASGAHLGSAGKAGEGPGEFSALVWLQHLAGDTVAAYDFDLRRISVLDGQASFVRTFQIPPDAQGDRTMAIGLFGDGSVLLQSRGGPVSQGAYRDTLSYFRFTSWDGVVARLGRFPGWEKFFWSQGNTRGLADHPFGRGSFPVAHADRFVLGINDGYEFAEYALDGSPIRLVRREHRLLPVTPEDVARYKERQLEAAREFWQGLFPHVTFAQTLPAYRDLIVDTEGYFWLEEFRRPGDEIPQWTVFTPEGRMLGTLAVPSGLRVFEVGADYILGVWRDDLDVEHVRLHGLRRGV